MHKDVHFVLISSVIFNSGKHNITREQLLTSMNETDVIDNSIRKNKYSY